MPLYDFVCPNCGQTKEKFIKLNEQEPVCDKCNSRMRKAISAPAFILKGGGWYKDLYGLKKPTKKGGKKKDGS